MLCARIVLCVCVLCMCGVCVCVLCAYGVCDVCVCVYVCVVWCVCIWCAYIWCVYVVCKKYYCYYIDNLVFKIHLVFLADIRTIVSKMDWSEQHEVVWPVRK